MKKLSFLSLLLASFISTAALADSVDGTIVAIDETANTITLDNGVNYDMPGEFDYSAIQNGMKVLVFFDKQGGKRYISDIELKDAPMADVDPQSNTDGKQ